MRPNIRYDVSAESKLDENVAIILLPHILEITFFRKGCKLILIALNRNVSKVPRRRIKFKTNVYLIQYLIR